MGLHYLCSENKGADQLRSYSYAKSRFSYTEAQLIRDAMFVCLTNDEHSISNQFSIGDSSSTKFM